ncbi:MAG: hypothetical protein ACYC75_00185 [Minisyncoccota bacterium]
MDNPPGVQFDEPEYARPAAFQKGPSGIIGLVIKLKLAKDEAGAQKVLLIVIVVCVLIMIAVWWSSTSSAPALVPLPPNHY